MEAMIKNYRQGKRTQTDNQMVLYYDDMSVEAGKKLVGKKVTYTCEGGKKKITGVVSALHGTKGAVRARFDSGMPGQSLGGRVQIE